MAFPDLPRPRSLRWLIGPRLPFNQNGFQGAHVLGNRFWLDDIQWLDDLKFPTNADTLSSGVLHPESERGNLVLGAASHLGNHFGAFDGLFYDTDDSDDKTSNLYLNRLERDRQDDLDAANIELADDPEALAARLAQIDFGYRIEVRNFLDYAKVLFLHDDVLDELGFGDLESLVLNTADARYTRGEDVLARIGELAALMAPGGSGPGLFDYDAVKANALFQRIEELRGSGPNAIDDPIDAILADEIPALSRLFYPGGTIVWDEDTRADILGRDALTNGYLTRIAGVERADYEGFLRGMESLGPSSNRDARTRRRHNSAPRCRKSALPSECTR